MKGVFFLFFKWPESTKMAQGQLYSFSLIKNDRIYEYTWNLETFSCQIGRWLVNCYQTIWLLSHMESRRISVSESQFASYFQTLRYTITTKSRLMNVPLCHCQLASLPSRFCRFIKNKLKINFKKVWPVLKMFVIPLMGYYRVTSMKQKLN